MLDGKSVGWNALMEWMSEIWKYSICLKVKYNISVRIIFIITNCIEIGMTIKIWGKKKEYEKAIFIWRNMLLL